MDSNLTVYESGLIYHLIESTWKEEFAKNLNLLSKTKKLVKALIILPKSRDFSFLRRERMEEVLRKKREELIYKSIGYHAFNMYAFAILKQQLPNHPFWSSETLQKTIDYMQTAEYYKKLDKNRYGYAYNPPGFEVPFSLMVLKKMDSCASIEFTRKWTGEQFRRCLNMKTGKMERNTEDSQTHTARVYELTRVPREILEEVQINFV